MAAGTDLSALAAQQQQAEDFQLKLGQMTIQFNEAMAAAQAQQDAGKEIQDK